MQSLFPEVCTNGNKLNLLERCGHRMVATGAFGLLRLRGPHLWCLDRVGLIPSFWVKFDVPKRLGGNEKRFGCSFLIWRRIESLVVT